MSAKLMRLRSSQQGQFQKGTTGSVLLFRAETCAISGNGYQMLTAYHGFLFGKGALSAMCDAQARQLT
jgi:hypothetical protein